MLGEASWLRMQRMMMQLHLSASVSVTSQYFQQERNIRQQGIDLKLLALQNRLSGIFCSSADQDIYFSSHLALLHL